MKTGPLNFTPFISMRGKSLRHMMQFPLILSDKGDKCCRLLPPLADRKGPTGTCSFRRSQNINFYTFQLCFWMFCCLRAVNSVWSWNQERLHSCLKLVRARRIDLSQIQATMNRLKTNTLLLLNLHFTRWKRSFLL